ncbi:unnamed protein product, partial [Candidula unifasciata]
MSVNGKSKSVTSRNPDYMNILYTDSESDSIPDLKLPPIKGKKLRKRKGGGQRSENLCCDFWTMVKLITAVVVFIVWIILSAMSFWSLRRISEMQEQISALENSNKASTELLKFQSQLAEVNTSVVAVKTGQGGLQEITNTFVEVQKKLKDLETANKELQASVSASKDFLNMPNKLETLSNTLASLGSDVSRLDKDTQTLQKAHFEDRIAALEKSMKEKNATASMTPDKQLETASFNESLHSGLQSLRQELDQFSARISVLEKFTSQPRPASDTAWVTEIVGKLLQEKMANMTVGDQGASNISQPNQVPAGVLPTDKGEFLAFKDDMLDNVEKINETVVILNQELETIAAHLDSHDQALINLTSAILRVGKAVTDHNPGDAGAAATSNNPPTSLPVSTPTGSSHQESSTAPPVLKIKGINSLEDLHKAFNSSWPVDKGQLDVGLLEEDGSPINRSQYKQFDFDHNGLFNEEELAVALGFQHNPR